MKYIVYDYATAFGIEEDQFKPELFLDKNLFDPATGEMFVVTADGMVALSKQEETPVEPEEPTEPEVEETPSEEEITE